MIGCHFTANNKGLDAAGAKPPLAFAKCRAGLVACPYEIRCSVTVNSQGYACYGLAIAGIKLPGNSTEVVVSRGGNRKATSLRVVSQLGEVFALCAMVNTCEYGQLSLTRH
jgi:hypothetical protein